jgi:hypothetical protein
MNQWLRERPPSVRILAYVMAAALVFVVSAGVGALGALMLRGDLGLPGTEEPQPLQTQNAAQPQQKHAASDTAAQQSEAEYTGKVGDIQAESVETFLNSHHKLLRYDALTAEDVEKLHNDQVLLSGSTHQVDELDPPQNYKEHHEVFRSAVNELHEAARLAYSLAADPTAATQSGFYEYDRHVRIAADRLQRSNEILGRDYKIIDGVQEVSPL